MNRDISRRDWLKGSSAVAIAMIAGSRANAQDMTVPGFIPSKDTPLRLSSNENPYGVSKKAREAIMEALEHSHLYSSRREGENKLAALLAEIEGVGIKNITFSGGSGEILKTLGLITAMEGGSVLTADPTYHGLTRYAINRNVEIKRVPVDDTMTIDLDLFREAYTDDVSIIYLVNPNNPLPTIMEKNKLRDFCIEMSKKCLVFIDEAYHEFVDNPDYATMVPLTATHENIVVARTASKIHGFAGIRLGVAYGSEMWIEKINEYITGSTNQLACSGALASYRDTDTQKFILQKNRESKEIVYNLFDKHNVRYMKSNTNFIFFETGIDVNEVRERFQKHGILVGRQFPPYLTWCRVSMGKPEDMEYFAQIYEKEFVS
ncbi:MAG: histidinol-phosphate transaminase [Emcibacteraceae bacterium]|nr:histidinol-phosphate transaminase [Emcibacteraceae bacterium]